ncbi:MAG TPA: saccharopine dehydrogenase, partial [Porphyromonadaceae bacterium]|nr:saccharopine dehydrogenase [Porphyromonadaceae bacterium]
MSRVLVIGAGGVSTVAVKKMAMNADVFTDIMVASRTKSKCDKIAADIENMTVQTAQVDADRVDGLLKLFESFKPDLVVNLALPYQDLSIMDAC